MEAAKSVNFVTFRALSANFGRDYPFHKRLGVVKNEGDFAQVEGVLGISVSNEKTRFLVDFWGRKSGF
jgi:hypothetical protein